MEADGPGVGGCDMGYRMTTCLWGRDPEPMVAALTRYLPRGASVLDAGCGEGRNTVHLAEAGFAVRAFDVSKQALTNASGAWPQYTDVRWELGDLFSVSLPPDGYDAVVMDSVLHWLESPDAVQRGVRRMQAATKPGGVHVVCSFNDRHQELSGHVNPPRCIRPHDWYLQLYEGWNLMETVDEDIVSAHSDVPDEHAHSVTKFLAVHRGLG
jgi:2-polyprenyl-3-methyl-5-hydroxy-6-metoxy-1,4-benzoquinol methylase